MKQQQQIQEQILRETQEKELEESLKLNQIIEERSTEINKIAKKTVELNKIMKKLSDLIKDQDQEIKEVKNNVKNANLNAELGLSFLRKNE